MSDFGEPSYGITTALQGVGYSEALERTRAALQAEGFGVLTSIDIKETLREKLGATHRDYIILGACNPSLAHRALQAEAPIGLVLPCNVVVTTDDEGNAVVSALDPVAQFGLVDRQELQPIASDVQERVKRAIAAVSQR